MPSYNQGKFIERSIKSILNQKYDNTQLIIIDGGSKDNTVEIIKKYQKNIYFWSSEPDKGQSDALNKGFKMANGEIYGWLNSDDLYMPNTFLTVANEFIKNKEKLIIFGDCNCIDKNDLIIEKEFAFDFDIGHYKYEGSNINAQSMFWRQEVHSLFNGFDIDLINTMDYQMILEFGIKIGNKGFLRLPQTLGACRKYDGQKTGSNKQLVFKEHVKMAKKFDYISIYNKPSLKKHLYYKFRRAYWYLIRGGVKELYRHVISA